MCRCALGSETCKLPFYGVSRCTKKQFIVAGVNKRTSCKHFFKISSFKISTSPSLYIHEMVMVMFYKFKPTSTTTVTDLHTNNNRQRTKQGTNPVIDCNSLPRIRKTLGKIV